MGRANTGSFRSLARCQTRGRLFVRGRVTPDNQALSNRSAGIEVGVDRLLTARTPDQWGSRLRALTWLSYCVAHHLCPTTCTEPPGVFGGHPAGEDTSVPGCRAGKMDPLAPQPIGSLGVGAPGILAPLRAAGAQVLADQDHSARCLGKVHDAPTEPVCCVSCVSIQYPAAAPWPRAPRCLAPLLR
jgi:hypothetical protein